MVVDELLSCKTFLALLLLIADATLEQRVKDILENADINYEMAGNERNEFEALFFQTIHQRSVFAQFGEVIQLDATCKVSLSFFT